MRTGDIVFVRGKTWVSKIIRFFDKGEFTHVAIAVSPHTVIEVERFTRARISPIHYEDYEIVSLGLNIFQQKTIRNHAKTLVGKHYDYWQILGELLEDLFNLKGRNRFNNPNKYICSELVGELLTAAGILQDSQEVRDFTPNELYEAVKHLAETRRPS